MKRLLILTGLAILLAAPTVGYESTQFAVQPLWWTETICDTIAANDLNRWDLTASLVEVAIFTSDQAGSLIWWNPSSAIYAAPTAYWHFEADEVATITAKGGIDSLEVHNTSGTVANARLIGQRR